MELKNTKAVLAVDLGGTKLAAALMDETGRVLAERHAPVIRDDWPATIRQRLYAKSGGRAGIPPQLTT
jgi:predicted NBD/HSP70 family sugar kinase